MRGRGGALLLFGAFAALALALFRPALRGPFVSDDWGYIVASPYTRSLDARSVVEILDPTGGARIFTANYAPLHLLLTAVERQIFADEVLGYHLVNVLLHALCCALLVGLLTDAGVPRPGALLGALLFAVHPANVEAVAWISQSKTVASLALALGALRLLSRRPALATALFALGLLTKASAAAALPAAAALAWAEPGRPRSRARWLGVWLALFAVYAVAELGAHARTGLVAETGLDDPGVRVRTMAAVGARYLVMAATSLGVSAYHEPPPARSLVDPWWLLALPLAALLGGRLLLQLRRRRPEAAFWVFAAAGFAPVSQLSPFVNPIADRYLYFILPGLIGGALLWLADAARARPLSPALPRVAAAAVLALAAVFGLKSAARAGLWQSETKLLLDAARHYPQGGTAHFLRARRAAQEGDVEAAVAALREAERRHAARFGVLLRDPGLEPIRAAPAFRALLAEMAGRWIERSRELGVETQPELRMRALAHRVRGEREAAARALERALAVGGPDDAGVRAELRALRAERAGAGGAGAP